MTTELLPAVAILRASPAHRYSAPMSRPANQPRVQLGTRIAADLNELLEKRAKEEGMTKTAFVESLLWTALAMNDPDEPQLPPTFHNLIDRIGEALVKQLKDKDVAPH